MTGAGTPNSFSARAKTSAYSFIFCAPISSRDLLTVRLENSVKVCLNTPWARSRLSTFSVDGGTGERTVDDVGRNALGDRLRLDALQEGAEIAAACGGGVAAQERGRLVSARKRDGCKEHAGLLSDHHNSFLSAAGREAPPLAVNVPKMQSAAALSEHYDGKKKMGRFAALLHRTVAVVIPAWKRRRPNSSSSWPSRQRR